MLNSKMVVLMKRCSFLFDFKSHFLIADREIDIYIYWRKQLPQLSCGEDHLSRFLNFSIQDSY